MNIFPLFTKNPYSENLEATRNSITIGTSFSLAMDKIAVLDFGGQYAHLIANKIRRLGVYSEILDANTPAAQLKAYKGIILSGGPQSVYEPGAPTCDPAILNLQIPLLGICYGHQLLAYIQKAKVAPGKTREYGLAELIIKKNEGILKDVPQHQSVWMSHGDAVAELPPGYGVLASTEDCDLAAVANPEKNFFGVQFHLEVTHTPSGLKILENFIDICGCKKEWKIENFLEQQLEEIRKKVGTKKVFMLVSGGVDSTVAFALLDKALGSERVYGLFVDTGLLRLNERQEVEASLKKLGFNNLHVHDASARYFEALKEQYAPEQKRTIIGELFLKVQAETAKNLNLNPEEWLLGQGTIYPDTIETGGTKHAAKIKTHHNRIPEIQELIQKGMVIEPLAELYKDEVRELGLKLGLPEKIIWRHPFPGPGLGVRTLCAKEESWPENHQNVEKNIQNFVHAQHLAAKLLPIQSVGVQGDFRTYRHPIVLIGQADFQTLNQLGTRLINQFKEVNRTLWLVKPENIASFKVKSGYITPERIQLLQKADAKVTAFLEKHGLMREIWQFPTVLVPLSMNEQEGETLVLRPVCSEEAMTANFYAMDQKLLQNLAEELMAIPGITAVLYDVTNKPPGTIEWE